MMAGRFFQPAPRGGRKEGSKEQAVSSTAGHSYGMVEPTKPGAAFTEETAEAYAKLEAAEYGGKLRKIIIPVGAEFVAKRANIHKEIADAKKTNANGVKTKSASNKAWINHSDYRLMEANCAHRVSDYLAKAGIIPKASTSFGLLPSTVAREASVEGKELAIRKFNKIINLGSVEDKRHYLVRLRGDLNKTYPSRYFSTLFQPNGVTSLKNAILTKNLQALSDEGVNKLYAEVVNLLIDKNYDMGRREQSTMDFYFKWYEDALKLGSAHPVPTVAVTPSRPGLR